MTVSSFPLLADSRPHPNIRRLSEQSMSDELLTISQIAQLTNRTVDTVRYWRLHGNGPTTFRSNGRVYARRSDVLAWLEAQAKPEDIRGGI